MLDVTIYYYHTNVKIDLVCEPQFLPVRHIVKPFSVSEPWNAFQWHFTEAIYAYRKLPFFPYVLFASLKSNP